MSNVGWAFVGVFSAILLMVIIVFVYYLIKYLIRPYEVTDLGTFRVFNTDICAVLPTCFGQNPDSPYARLIFKSAINSNSADALLGAFRMQTNDVIIVSGTTPPKCEYFGFTGYMYREADGSIPFASLGDTINQIDLPFDSKFTILMTGSQTLAERLASQYSTDSFVRILPIPMQDTVTPEDQVMIVMRTAYFDDPSEGEKYLSDVPISAVQASYRLKHDNVLYPRLPLYERPLLPDERAVYQDEFDQYLSEESSKFTVLDTFEFRPFLYQYDYDSGYTCIDNDLECLGDNRDAAYLVSDTLDLGDNQAFVVIGVNHVATGKAVYTSQSLYDQQIQFGLTSFSDADLEPGTKFYTFIFTRRLIPGIDPKIQYVITNSELHLLTLAERAYVQPGYHVGSETETLIWPKCLLVNIPIRV
jgi:hypothetical protein